MPGICGNFSGLTGVYLRLQIGDQLGDTDSEAWANAMARKLIATKWSDDTESEPMQILILSLNSNLQGLVFRQLGKGEDIMAAVISKWPLAMQQVRGYTS